MRLINRREAGLGAVGVSLLSGEAACSGLAGPHTACLEGRSTADTKEDTWSSPGVGRAELAPEAGKAWAWRGRALGGEETGGRPDRLCAGSAVGAVEGVGAVGAVGGCRRCGGRGG